MTLQTSNMVETHRTTVPLYNTIMESCFGSSLGIIFHNWVPRRFLIQHLQRQVTCCGLKPFSIICVAPSPCPSSHGSLDLSYENHRAPAIPCLKSSGKMKHNMQKDFEIHGHICVAAHMFKPKHHVVR